MALPAGFGYATIHGKYISAVLDSADADREPDAVPMANLTISLTPSPPTALLKSLSDPPVTVVLTQIVAFTDVNGVVVGPDGQPGIMIVASDYPDPENPWTYAVSITGVGFPKTTFNLVAHSGDVIDLTTVLEAPSSGIDLSNWEALALQVQQDADRAEAAAAGGVSGAVASVAGRTGAVTLTADDLTDATSLGKALVRAADAAAARAAIGAGSSDVVIGTTAGTAADAGAMNTALAGKEPSVAAGTSGQYYDGTKTWKDFPTNPAVNADSITDATATGKSLIRALDAAAARTAIGAGTSSLALGTTAGTAKAGDYQPSAINITDSTTVGRSVLTAANAAAARTAIGAGTSDLAIGTTGSTAKAGNYQPTAANISDSTATGRSLLTAVSAAAARTAIGAGVSDVSIGTTAGTAADAAAVTAALAGKEASLPAGGTTAQYLRGDKTWQTLPTGGSSPTLANLPAGTLHVQTWDGVTGSQPVRDTSRADIPVQWRQPVAPPSGGNYALAGDTWLTTS